MRNMKIVAAFVSMSVFAVDAFAYINRGNVGIPGEVGLDTWMRYITGPFAYYIALVGFVALYFVWHSGHLAEAGPKTIMAITAVGFVLGANAIITLLFGSMVITPADIALMAGM